MIKKNINKKKKILIINFNISLLMLNPDYPAGGATMQTMHWINGLIQNNCSVAILINKDVNQTNAYESQFNGLKHERISYLYCYDEKKGIRLLRNIYYRFPRLFSAILNYHPDIIYCDVPGWQSLMYAIISKIARAHYIQRISNDYFTDKRCMQDMGKLKYTLMMSALKISDTVLCQNEYQYRKLSANKNQNNITVLHNPFTISDEYKASRWSADNDYIAWLGIFQYQKNLPLLLNMVEALPEYKFKIAGKALPLIDEETTEALSCLQKKANVEFVGFLRRKEVAAFLSKAKILLNTSYYEGFSNTFLESMAVGTSIVTIKNNDADQIISNNKLGFIAEGVNDLAEVIKEAMLNKQLSEYSKRCINYVRKNHSPDNLAAKLLQII